MQADAALRKYVGHFPDDQPGAPDGAAAEMHEMPVAHGAIRGRVLAHRRDDDAVGNGQPAQTNGREHRRRRTVARGRGVRHQRVDGAHQIGRRLLDARIGEPHAVGQEREAELLERQAAIAAHMLEPGARSVRGALQAVSLGPARGLKGRERVADACARDTPARRQMLGKRLGVFELRTQVEPDRPMRRIGGAAKKNDIAGVPDAIAHRGERIPDRAVGCRHDAVELQREQLAAERDDAFRWRAVEATHAQGLGRRFDDNARAIGTARQLPDMKDAVLGRPE